MRLILYQRIPTLVTNAEQCSTTKELMNTTISQPITGEDTILMLRRFFNFDITLIGAAHHCHPAPVFHPTATRGLAPLWNPTWVLQSRNMTYTDSILAGLSHSTNRSRRHLLRRRSATITRASRKASTIATCAASST